MKKLFLSLLVTLLPLVASAHDFEVDGIYYNITDNEKLTVGVTYRGTSATSRKGEYSGNVVIPETVAYDSKTYSVTSIEDGAFYDCDISMLTVGANVLSIGDNQSTPTKTIWLTKTTPNGYKNLSGKINYVPNEQYTSFSNKQVSKYLNAIFEVDGMTFIPINPSERTCDLIDYNSSLSASTVTVEKTVSFKNVAMTVKNIMPYTFYNNKTIKSITIKNEGNIGDYAFYGCKNLNSVTMDDNVTGIGYNSFENCTSLASIVIPNSVTDIGDYAFNGCKKLFYVSIGNGVTSIERDAFHDCDELQYIILGKNITSIGENAFFSTHRQPTVINCSALNITDSAAHHHLTSDIIRKGEVINDFVFDEFGYLRGYMNNTKNLVLPETNNISGNYTISKYAFYKREFTSVIIPNSVMEIINEAFYGCWNLKTVINKSDIDITKGSYNNGCVAYYASKVYTGKDYDLLNGFIFNKLKREYFLIDYTDNKNEVTLPDNYKGGTYGLGEKAFLGHSNLTSINLPNCITSIGNEAFSGCSGLTSISIPNSVTSIGEKAFSGCSGLTSISIPNSVESIGDRTFTGCNKITNVTIEERENSLTLGSNGTDPFFSDCPLDTVYIGGKIIYNSSSSYGYSPFYKNTSLQTLIVGDKEDEIYANEFYGCTNLKNVQIGDGVKSIGDWAFSGCSNLDYFAFGTGLQSIGKEAFSDCVNVTKLISYAVAPPKCGEMALDDINKWNCTLQIPQQSLAAYQAADQWKEFFFIEGFDATGIEGVTADNPSLNAKANVYTLDGTLIKGNANISNLSNELPKGIYIVNGKKFYVK